MSNVLSSDAQLKIEYLHVGLLKPYANNARKHPKGQIKKLAQSLKAFGWTNPLIIDSEGMVLCGHGRLEAAISLGMAIVPTITLEHLSEADRRAYVIADNALAERATWSRKTLATELSGLAELGYELELTGFDTIQIDTFLSFDEAEEAPDDDVELPSDGYRPVSRLRDLWTIGAHKLAVGDARDRDVYQQLLGNERVQLIITDPPYGCAIENNVSGNGRRRIIFGLILGQLSDLVSERHSSFSSADDIVASRARRSSSHADITRRLRCGRRSHPRACRARSRDPCGAGQSALRGSYAAASQWRRSGRRLWRRRRAGAGRSPSRFSIGAAIWLGQAPSPRLPDRRLSLRSRPR
jgi:hypothetical protein